MKVMMKWWRFIVEISSRGRIPGSLSTKAQASD